jgi:hypothetical protein
MLSAAIQQLVAAWKVVAEVQAATGSLRVHMIGKRHSCGLKDCWREASGAPNSG